jgi:3-deoxy-D-manno-octulosonic-acid transferase
MAECGRRGVPVAVVNGRLSPGSFRGYRRVRRLVRKMFGQVALAAVQTREYGDRFEALGTPSGRIRVVDNLKWEVPLVEDSPLPSPSPPSAARLAEALGIDPGRPLVVAGSTADGEEERVLEGLDESVQVLLAPRRPERFEEVASLFPGVVRRTLHPDGTRRAPDPATRVFLLDTLGELRTAYALADVVVVGRSFGKGMGGSDPIEAAALGKAVITGPDHGNFSDVVAAFLSRDAIVVAEHPGHAAAALLADTTGRQDLSGRAMDVIRTRRGAASRTAEALLELLGRG